MKSLHTHLLTLTLAGLLGAATAPVLAQSMAEAAAPAGASSFNSFDSNKDGQISLEEFKAQGGDEQVFAAVDADQDKRLSRDEFAGLGKPSPQRY